MRKAIVMDETSNPFEYNQVMIAEFLGWTNHRRGEETQPDDRTRVAFMALDAMDEGSVKASDLRGLRREQIRQLILSMRQIRETEEREARRQQEQAEAARRRAAETRSDTERARQEQRAAVFEAQAKGAEADAERKPAEFRQEAVNGFRNQELSVHGARQKARDMTDPSMSRAKIKEVDDIGARVCKRLDQWLEDDELAKDVRFLKTHRGDLSDEMARRILACARAVLQRIERRILHGIDDTSRRNATTAGPGGRRAIAAPRPALDRAEVD